MDNLFPCPFVESADQYHATGICHGVGKTKCGRPYAILEYDGGEIKIRRLDEHYTVKLILEKT